MEQVALLASYLLGSIPTGYLLVRWITGKDVRKTGSGNIGATNVKRAAGSGAGLAVLILDMLKGWVSAQVIALRLIPGAKPELVMACGAAAVLGHVFSCFLNFKGGKGVATVLGALAGSDPMLALWIMAIWGAVFAISFYVSVASLVAAMAIPVAQIIMHRSSGEVALGALMAAVIVFRHRENFQRLMSGSEHRAWTKK